MKVLLFGATGMVGQGVLRECLLDADVSEVVVVGRTTLGQSNSKLTEVLRPDLTKLDDVMPQLAACDACLFCLGVSSAGMNEADYTRVTYDLTMAVARPLADKNPKMTFIYVSGESTDSTEKGGTMWARVKGKTENDLIKLFKNAYMFRPGFIRPMNGEKPKATAYKVAYVVMRPLFALVPLIVPNKSTTTEKVGKAMLVAAKRGAPQKIIHTVDINALAT